MKKGKVKYLKESNQLLCSFCNVKGALDHLRSPSYSDTIQKNPMISWLHLYSYSLCGSFPIFKLCRKKALEKAER